MMNEGGDNGVIDNGRSGDLQEEALPRLDRSEEPSGSARGILSVRYDDQDALPVALAQPLPQEQQFQGQYIGPGAAQFQGVAQLLNGDHRGVDIVSQGSPIIRVLSFGGGVASAVMSLFALVNPVMVLVHPLMWLVHFYQLIFSVTTLIFEAKPEWVHHFNMLENYKEILVENARFMARCLGRGMFYIFQSTLWACLGYSQPVESSTQTAAIDTIERLYHLLAIVLSILMFGVGFAHVLMHFGIMPSHYAVTLNRVGREAGTRVSTFVSAIHERSTQMSANVREFRASESAPSDMQVELSATHQVESW